MEKTAAPHKLSFWEKMFVGMGGMPMCFGNISVKSMSVSVYQMLLGVNPGWLGVVLAIPRLWDAITNPVVGNISDNFRSRFGRRRPFIVVGAICTALSYGSLWMVSPDWSENAKLIYLLVTSLIFYTCYAVFSIPYQSLTYEMSPDYNERTHVMGHTTFWYKAGEFVYQWIFPISQLAIFGSSMMGVRIMNWGVAILLLGVMGVIPAIFGKERYFHQAEKQAKMPFWTSFLAASKNVALLILVTLTLLKVFANMLASSMDHYLLVYYMHDGDILVGSYWKGLLSSAYAVVGFVAIPVLAKLSDRFGKKEAILIVYIMVVLGGIAKWFLYTPGVTWLLIIDPILNGPVWVAIGMIIPSMIADACDEDELKTGQRREGMFGAVFNWIQKVGISLAFLGTGIALNVSGFDSNLGGDQSPETFFWMRFMLAGATAISGMLAIVVVLFYPITRKKAEETRRLLEARRGGV